MTYSVNNDFTRKNKIKSGGLCALSHIPKNDPKTVSQ